MTKRPRDESSVNGNPMPPSKNPKLMTEEEKQRVSSAAPATAAAPGQGNESGASDKQGIHTNDALAYLEQVRLQFSDRPDVYVKFLDIMREYQMHIIDVPEIKQRVKFLFKDHPQLILGFNTFLPPGHRISLNEETQNTAAATTTTTTGAPSAATDSEKDEFDEAISFVTRIKERFKDQSETYKKFLDCLHRYQMGTTTIASVYEEVTTLFKDQEDLLEDFKKFLPKPVQEEAQKRMKSKKKKEPAQQNATQSPGQANAAVPTVPPSTAIIQQQMQLASGKTLEELEDPFERLKHARPDSEKYGPSYRLPPKNYPQAVCSQRSDLCRQVLNDELVSVPAGSEESRDAGGRDPAAETLFQCEDDRCELDIVLEQNMSTLRLFSPLNDQIRNGQHAEFSVKDLKDVHRAAIHRIYGDKWVDVLESLKKKPQHAIPIIFARLQQKAQEWESARKELNVFWRNLYKENTLRAENQESSRFKSLEKKRLNPNDIVQDIHDRHLYHNDLVCNMTDRMIHRDIFMLLKKYGEWDKDQDAQLKKLWLRFVIPLFSLEKKSQKPQSKEDSGNGAKENTTESNTEQNSTTTNSNNELIQPLVEQKLNPHFSVHKFYGDITFLLFMRYYTYMYDRLKNAKHRSLYQQSVHQRKRDQKSVSSIVEKHASEVLDMDQFSGYISGAALSKKKKQKQEKINADDFTTPNPESDTTTNYYQQVLTCIGDLLRKEMEQDVYEKSIRKYVGYQSYELFTFSKLFKVLKNNIITLVNEERSEKLLQSFEYERQRINAFQDRNYYHNAQKLLGQDAYLYCFTYHLQNRRCIVSMISPPNNDLAKTEREKQGLEYVQQYVESRAKKEAEQQESDSAAEAKEADSSPKSEHRGIFLRRNINKTTPEQAKQNLKLVNGLECKICIATFKMFYVQDTWDLMVRTSRKGSSPKQQKEEKQKKFHEWIDRRLKEIETSQEDKMQDE